MSSRRIIEASLALLPALALFLVIALSLSFIQDDAYISYRYVANFLNGDGLVYNVGERVEGFTNLGWVIYLILIGGMGLDFVLASKIAGLLLGLGVIILSYLIALRVFGAGQRVLALVPAYLVAANQSLAYWSPAGLETAAFAFLATAALYLYLRRSFLLIAALTLAVWIRPDGAVLTGGLIVVEWIILRRIPRFTLTCAAMALLFSIPMVGFKLLYYGSILPNPFYAKTGLHLDHVASGLEYAWRFFGHYGFYGAFLVIPLLFFKRVNVAVQQVWLFAVVYTIYIVLVGGDVLKVHRFFLPILGAVGLLSVESVRLLMSRFRIPPKTLYILIGVLPLCLFTWYLPHDFVRQYNTLEKGFTKKMGFMATEMKRTDTTDFSVALPTIGRFGYELLGHDIIDMVGLTDSTIARHSEEPIVGMATTWKEQKHNSSYLLGRAPDYIVFSTDIKPSAPAERALLLYKPFLEAYHSTCWYYQSDPTRQGILIIAFKRMREIKGELIPTYPIEYVQHYKDGLDAYVSGDHRRAVQCYDRAIGASPKPYNVHLLYQKAFSLLYMGQEQTAFALLNEIVSQDSLMFQAHKDLYMYSRLYGDETKAAIHERWVKKLAPWYFPRLKMLTERNLQLMREG